MSRRKARGIAGLLAATAAGVAVVWAWPRVFGRRDTNPPPAQAAPAAPAAEALQASAGAATRPAGSEGKPAAVTAPLPPTAPPSPARRQAAVELLARGLSLTQAGKLIEARAALADALNSGGLDSGQTDTTRARLADLAQTTLFSPRAFADDPCVIWHRFQPGEVLVRLERELALHVPNQLVLRINGIADARRIRAGESVKLIRGPFHAVVSKGRFTMDVYLQEHGTGRMIFVRRFAVGSGAEGATPLGKWRVSLGRKLTHAAWIPPTSSKLPPKRILWGQKGYPLGPKGYWISLEGIEGNPHTAEDGYGIHGTNDPSSIGKAASLGCIRLSAEDIELVFALLYEKWSTVTVVP